MNNLLSEPLRNGVFKEPERVGNGVKLINVFDLYGDTTVDLEKVERFDATADELQTFAAYPGDVFFTRSSLKPQGVAWTAYLEEADEPVVFECHLIRVKVNQDKIMPAYFSNYCRTALPRKYLMARASVTTMATIDQPAVLELPVIVPHLDIQRKLVSEMELARASRKAKLAEADALLAGLDDYLLDQLGLTPPKPDGRLAFAIPMKMIASSKQIGADYFHPERLDAMKAIQKAKNAKRSKRLEKIGDFHRDVAKEFEPEQYLGLADVQSETGELSNTNDEPGKGQSFRFKEKDVLFARLRPYLNKVWLAEFSGVCSKEFHVIRIKSEQRQEILPGYLAAVLRSSVVVAQTKHMMTGNTHPRLANDDVVDLFVPIPDTDTQQDIVDELRSRRLEARRLRDEAAQEWEAAKAHFEAQLLGEESV